MVEEAISFWTEIQRYEDMLAADPHSYCFAPLSELYRKLGLLDDAISVAKKGCELHPDYPGGFFALGSAYCEKGLKEEARAALERVVVFNPDNLSAQRLLGQLYAEAGEIALAKKALGQVLLQNPDDAESALLLRSLAPSTSGAAPDEEFLEEAEVIEELTELLEEEDNLVDQVDVERLEESQESGWFEEPDEPEESIAQSASRDPLTTATLAELYVSQGHLDKALAIYQQLLATDPTNRQFRAKCEELQAARERQGEAAIPGTTARPEPPPLPAQAAAPPGDAVAELSRWLENIRRKKDGI